MFLLYVSGTYMPASGGAEISMYTLLRCFAERGHRIAVFTSNHVPTSSVYGSAVGIDVHHVTAGNLPGALREFCAERAVQLIATQNLWADRAIRFARESRIPSVYYARSADGSLDISVGGEYEPTFVIANSKHVAAFVKKQWLREAPVIRSIVILKDYAATGGSKSYITMINPINVHKGGHIFRKIAGEFRSRAFLAIQGWGHLRTGDEWNMPLLRDLASGLGSSDVWVPEDTDLSGLNNVTFWRSTSDMKRVYGETRLLLVPSTKTESIPRVAIEAMSNGIPVVGSALGGLVEVLSSTGVLVHDYENPAAWMDAITSLDEPNLYRDISAASKRYAETFDYSAEVSRCASLFLEIVENFAQGASI